MRRVGVILAGGLLWPATAWAVPTQPGELVNPLVTPFGCELCHQYDNPVAQAGEPDYSPYRTWQGSMMANAARDPVFWAGIAVADADIPGQTELCIRCHSPRAFLEGNGLATAMEDLTEDQQQGVECMLCHRTMEDPPVPPGNAMYTVDDVVVGSNVPRRGPFDYTDGVPEPPHSYITDPYLGTSRFCGTCHDVTTPVERVDDAGVGMGVDFNEQRTYSEWLRSDFAIPGDDFASCQDCHMPAVDDLAGCALHAAMGSTHETGGRRHDLVGANRFMVELLQQEYGSAGANLIADFYYDDQLEKMDAFLPTSATLEIDAPTEVELAVGLSPLDVRVINNTGHKLPSGYSEGRIMWLQVEASYAGEVVWSSGAWDQDAGEIESDAQLRTYQAIGEEYATGTEFHLLLNNHWVVDNRIPPLGLQPNIDTDPVGDRYTLLGTGVWPNYDDVSYAFDPAPDVVDATPEDGTDDELTVAIRVQYLINTPEYIEFLGDNGGEAGEHVAMLFDTAGGATPVTLAEEILTIPIVNLPVGPSTTTTTGGSSSSSGGDDPSSSGPPPGTSSTTMPPTTNPTTLPPGTGSGDTGDETGQSGGGEGCGCRGGGGGHGLLLLPLLVGLLPHRRRRNRL